jgi:hypothetical protein
LSGQGTKALTGILGLQRAARLRGHTVEGHDPVEMVVFVLRADRGGAVQPLFVDLLPSGVSSAS